MKKKKCPVSYIFLKGRVVTPSFRISGNFFVCAYFASIDALPEVWHLFFGRTTKKKIVCFIKFTRKKNNHYWRMGGIRLLVVEPWKNKFNVFLSLVCVNSRGWWNIIRLTNFQPRHKKIYNSFLCLLGPEILNRILKYVIRVFPIIIYLISLHPGVLTQ